jgi:hypothetical protein
MAFCPKCKSAMGATAVACPTCGYDFPSDSSVDTTGFEYSAWADLCLVVGAMSAGIGALATLLAAVQAIAYRQWLMGAVVYPLVAMNQLAFLVVIVRLQGNGGQRRL